MGGFKSRSIIVNHVVGCLLVGSRRGVKSGAGGRHIMHGYGGGAISLIVVGRSHFWGTAARSKCLHAHPFGWSLASSMLPRGGIHLAVWVFLGLVVCVLGFALVLGVAFGCRVLSILLLVVFTDCCNEGLA